MIRKSVAEILDHHVIFELEAIDRMYLNAYMPSLQTGGLRVLPEDAARRPGAVDRDDRTDEPAMPLGNGIRSTDEAARVQRIANELDAAKIDAVFRQWLRRLPHPFTAAHRKAG